MITTWTQPTWASSGPGFLWLYGALCAGAAIGLWLWRRAAGGPVPSGPEPDLGIHELAMLGEGPQLAITSAATQLLRDGVLERGAADGMLDVAGELARSRPARACGARGGRARARDERSDARRGRRARR